MNHFMRLTSDPRSCETPVVTDRHRRPQESSHYVQPAPTTRHHASSYQVADASQYRGSHTRTPTPPSPNAAARAKDHQSTYELPATPPYSSISSSSTTPVQHAQRRGRPQRITNEQTDAAAINIDTITKLKAAISAANELLIQKTIEAKLAERAIEDLWDQLLRATPAPAATPVSYDEFIQLIQDEGLEHLAQHTNVLDPSADYAVAATPEAGQKRCKVGRPRGRILKAHRQDDLARELCSYHKDEKGFTFQVTKKGRDPWVCYPMNGLDEED
jgi:hypothetical protein